jgi:2-iminobutanoate/2-iminopropanoate deaminase
MKSIISTPHAPAAIGPYSQGVLAQGKFLFVSGQIGFNPSTGELVEGGIEAQATQALENVKAILEAGGSNLAQVVKATVLLKTMADFAALNAVYATYFTHEPPARATFGGLELPRGALVEVECVALIPD